MLTSVKQIGISEYIVNIRSVVIAYKCTHARTHTNRAQKLIACFSSKGLIQKFCESHPQLIVALSYVKARLSVGRRVRPSVCPSHAGNASKLMTAGSRSFCDRVSKGR